MQPKEDGTLKGKTTLCTQEETGGVTSKHKVEKWTVKDK